MLNVHKSTWYNEIVKDGENIDDVFSIFYKTLSEDVSCRLPCAFN